MYRHMLSLLTQVAILSVALMSSDVVALAYGCVNGVCN